MSGSDGEPIVAKIVVGRQHAKRTDWELANQVYYFVDWQGCYPPPVSQGYDHEMDFLCALPG